MPASDLDVLSSFGGVLVQRKQHVAQVAVRRTATRLHALFLAQATDRVRVHSCKRFLSSRAEIAGELLTDVIGLLLQKNVISQTRNAFEQQYVYKCCDLCTET